MNVVNAIAKDDVIKRSLLQKALWQKVWCSQSILWLFSK
jgi:hypothetical protein